ncbi:phosphatase PAP2-related protein [Ornithinimicrobium kibberense]|uniref:Phosphatase PAP2-related protein n=1 Tax=Ornithinimicrobium kibberense TaxID=282060 RepID=A0ABV5V4E2_9MICO|nr:phosphatase PAP2-related protein [Ornithinimicrobium kibberense]
MDHAPVGARPRSLAAAWTLALTLGLLALTATLLGNQLIVTRFADAVRPDDLLFELLPYVRPARWLTLATLVVGFGAFLGDLVRSGRTALLPAVGAVFAVMYLLRAGIMVLTPLAPAQGEGPFLFSPQQYGMFPSGHVAALTLLAMLTPADRPRLRTLQRVLVALMAAALVLAHGHYSIDVVGGLLLAFFVVRAWGSGPVLGPVARVTGPGTVAHRRLGTGRAPDGCDGP